MKNEKKLFQFLIYLFLFGCSFNSGGWNDLSEEIRVAKERENSKIIFSTKKNFDQEINNEKLLKINGSSINKNWVEVFSNNEPDELSKLITKSLEAYSKCTDEDRNKQKDVISNLFNKLYEDFSDGFDNLLK